MAKDQAQEIAHRLADLLAAERRAKGISMNALGKCAGISYTMVGRIERGERKPTLDILLRISGALEIELWPLLREAETNRSKAGT